MVGLVVGLMDPCRCHDISNEWPIAILAHAQGSEMFPQQKDDPEFRAVLLIMLKGLGLP